MSCCALHVLYQHHTCSSAALNRATPVCPPSWCRHAASRLGGEWHLPFAEDPVSLFQPHHTLPRCRLLLSFAPPGLANQVLSAASFWVQGCVEERSEW